MYHQDLWSIFPQSWPHQECTGSCHENVPTPKAVSSDLQSTDGLAKLARTEIVAILVHYQPFYNTSHTMKPSDPLLLSQVTLRCWMYLAGKVDISQHLAVPGFLQSDYTFGKPSVDAGSLCSLLGLQGPQQNPTCKFLFHPFCKAALVIKKISLDFWLSLDWIKFNLWAKFGNLCHSVSSTIYLCLTIESIFSLFVTTMMGQWTKKRKQKPKAHSYPDNNNIPCTG